MNAKVATLNGYVVSDLHIFGCCSLYQHYLPVFYSQVASHEIIVLNGDTFDFKRSTLPSSTETTRHAIAWLADLAHRASAAQIFYILGNHDSHELFVRSLREALPALPNVSLIPDSLQLGSALFLHGDLVDLPDNNEDLAFVRAPYTHVEPTWQSRLFARAVTYLRANRIDYLRHSKRALAEKILCYLEKNQPQATKGISEVYFGHTHIPFDNFIYQGIRFRNTGSMIRGLPWRPLEFSHHPRSVSTYIA
jgi:UDP-2,3-diacylglucosamine pyrophosphatase LpxH